MNAKVFPHGFDPKLDAPDGLMNKKNEAEFWIFFLLDFLTFFKFSFLNEIWAQK